MSTISRSVLISKVRPIGGAQRVAIQQAEAFNLNAIYYLGTKRDKLEDIEFIPFWSFVSIMKIIKSDQIFTHSTLAGWIGRFLASIPMLNLRIYHTFHGFNSLKTAFGKYYLLIERIFSYTSFSAIFVCQADYILANKLKIVRSQRTRVIYNSSKNFSNSEMVDSSVNGKIRILSLARLADQKDFATLSEALKISTNSSICIDNYGGGDVEEYKRKYGSEKLRFFGEVDKLEKIICNYNYGILISNYEGMPISLLEMLSGGLKLIATDVGGVREIITSDIDGQLVRRHDVYELVNILNSLTKLSNIKSKKNEYKWHEFFSPQTYNSKLLDYANEKNNCRTPV